MKCVSIIDYGSGNLKSVYNALNKVLSKKTLCQKIIVTSNPKEIKDSSYIILPGVGSFKGCLNGLRSQPGLFESISENVLVKKKPFLGICVGMQMLANKGHEDGINKGFGWIQGEVKKIKTKDPLLKIPHIGWNNLKIKNTHSFINFLNSKGVFDGEDINAYFVHSYVFEVKNKLSQLISTEYDTEITAMIGLENILGTQFHPEKSQKFGLDFLESFISWDPNI